MTNTTKRNATLLNSGSLFVLGTASVLLGSGPAQAFDANALPTGGSVTGGAASIATSGNTLTVNQSSNRAIIDWRSFNIGANAQANFVQPGTSSIAVNRVNGSTDPSRIDGGLHANGQVWVLNPNGVFFGKTARVDAAGVVATTANINDKAFMAGSNKLQMTGGDSGQVVNEGHISVGEGGLAAFVAPSVRNSGVIRARVGKVTLAAGDTYTLDLAGDRLIEIGLGSTKAVVDQSGKIINAGGVIDISAKAAGQVVDAVINTSGVTDASSVKVAGGKIILGADVINVASTAAIKADGISGGQITAVANKTGNYAGSYSAQGTTGDGGQIETSGHTVTVASDAKISASSAQGKAGQWTLDPLDVTITSGAANGQTSGGTVTNGTIQATLAGGTRVVITTDQSGTDNGDLTLAASVNATSTGGADLTLTGRHLSATGGSSINIAGGALVLNVNAVNNTATPGGNWINDALKMIGSVTGGSTVNLGAGTYVVASGNYINVNLSNVTIDGAGQGQTIIDARNASTYGLRVSGPNSNVTLENFTLYGSSVYGLKAENTTNLTLRNITSQGAGKSEFDLNGVIGGTLTNLLANGAAVSGGAETAGNGISLTDSQNITLTNVITENNAWGGLALYQSNSPTGYPTQETGIIVDGSNIFNEANGIYAQDQSSTNNFGTINLNDQGIQYVSTVPTGGTDGTYYYFQKTQQGAIDLAATSPATGTVQGFDNGGVSGNNIFTVGHSTGGTNLSIQTAINAATSGATVNVLAGTYAEALNIFKGVDIEGAGIGQTIIQPTTLLSTGVNHKYDTNVKTTVFVHDATDVNLSGLTIDGNNLGNNAVVFWNNASGTISNALIENAMLFSGAQTGQGLAVDAAAGGHATDLTLNGVQFVNWNKNAIDAVNGDGATTGGGNITLTVNGGSFTGQGPISTNEQNGIVLWERGGGTINATVDGATFSDIDYTGGDNNATGILLYGSTTGSLTVKDSIFNGNVQKYIGTDGGTSVEVDATSGNTFNGVAQSGASLSDMFNIEDRLVDGVDNAGNSLVRLKAGQVYVTATKGSIQNGINAATTGNTVNVQTGTYAGGLTISKGLILAGETGAKINVGAGQTGVTINANDVTVEHLEIAGPVSGDYDTLTWTEPSSSGTGIVVTGNVSTGVNGFNILNNDIHDIRTGIIVQGASTSGSITGNRVENTKGGILIQYNDGSLYTITGNSEGTVGNEWGIVVNLNTAGINTAGAAPLSAQQNLLALAEANGGMAAMDRHYAQANRTRVVVDASSTATAADDGGHGNGLGSARQALSSIQSGINAVVTGGTVNVLNGTYVIPAGGSNYINVNKSLNLVGQSEDGVIIDARNASTYGLRVTAHDGPVSLSDFTLYGVTNGYGLKAEATQGLILANITSQGAGKSEFDLNGVIGGTLTNLNADGTAVSGGAETAGNGISLTDSQDITLTGVTTENNAWGGLALYQSNFPTGYPTQETGITVDGSNTFNETNGIYAQDQSSTNNFGTINLSGQGIQYVATVPTGGSDGTYTFFQKTQQGAIDQAVSNPATGTVQGYAGDSVNGNNIFTVGTSTGGTALSVNTALDASTTGGIIDVLNGTYAENMAIITPRTVNFDGATLDSLSVFAGGSGATLSGSVKAGSVTAVGDIVLGGDLSLDTSAAGGTIALANVDGAHNLTLNAGSTGVVLTGGLGATTRLGAVDITADLIGLGATNQAASFDFNGDVALSAASTVIDTTVSSTAAGNITFAGDIFGTTDGGQSLSLSAGPGTGDKSANGDIVMNNAGIGTLRLGSMTVSGDDFTALTVDLAGGFTSQLSGNQLFAADTLNAGGDVNSNVAGNVGGHIVSGGNVNLTSGGALSGDITGKVVSLTGQTVNSQVTANTLNVNTAQGGTITGTFTPGTVSNGLSLNGTVVGAPGNTGGNTANNFPNVNAQQLVVEGFALPAGTRIGANGQLILPAGTVLGLLSPGGGTPRVIMVQTVQELGALLDQGYSAIVIDLTGHKKATQVASN